jgi:hypothetical protein
MSGSYVWFRGTRNRSGREGPVRRGSRPCVPTAGADQGYEMVSRSAEINRALRARRAGAFGRGGYRRFGSARRVGAACRLLIWTWQQGSFSWQKPINTISPSNRLTTSVPMGCADCTDSIFLQQEGGEYFDVTFGPPRMVVCLLGFIAHRSQIMTSLMRSGA